MNDLETKSPSHPHAAMGRLGQHKQGTDLMDFTTNIDSAESIPHLNSETGQAIVRMLYVLGFPEHRIGFLFDADHGSVSEVLNSHATGFPDVSPEAQRTSCER